MTTLMEVHEPEIQEKPEAKESALKLSPPPFVRRFFSLMYCWKWIARREDGASGQRCPRSFSNA